MLAADPARAQADSVAAAERVPLPTQEMPRPVPNRQTAHKANAKARAANRATPQARPPTLVRRAQQKVRAPETPRTTQLPVPLVRMRQAGVDRRAASAQRIPAGLPVWVVRARLDLAPAQEDWAQVVEAAQAREVA